MEISAKKNARINLPIESYFLAMNNKNQDMKRIKSICIKNIAVWLQTMQVFRYFV